MDNPDIPLLFYRYSCEIIGTEEVVNARRHTYTAFDNAYSQRGCSLISSGSKAEGLDIKGSDLDLMIVDNNRLVYEKYDQVDLTRCCFLMDTSDCKPGYTKLKIPIPHECVLNKFCEYKTGEWFLSSERHRENTINDPRFINNGPCKSIYNSSGEYDLLKCFRCNDWVSQAKPWLSRRRDQWASTHVIDTILDFGVLVVPIGCKNSPYSDIEWRLSFSFAEKLLIWSFNHTQLMCYALLKILLKEVIKHFTGDLLCSYFLKTVMFWVCEETASYKWKEKKAMSCFMACLDRLIYCVRYETLLHFFIPENNFFENRFNKEQHMILLSTLIQLRKLRWTCLLQTETLQSFKNIMNPTLLLSPPCDCPFVSFSMTYEVFVLHRFPLNIERAIYFCLRPNNMLFQIFILSMFNQVVGQKLLKGETMYNSNKQTYNIYRERLCHLLIGLNTDMVSGWLLLASFFYVAKQYHVCRMIISDCLVRCTSDRYKVRDRSPKNLQTHLHFFERSHRFRHHNFFTKHSIRPVLLFNDSPILPKEFPQFSHWPFSPAAFSLFLKFLCCHHLSDKREKVKCLHDLKIVARDGCCMDNDQQSENADMFLSIAYSLLDDHNLHTFYDT